ncbi:MAG: hypothetical protein JXA52_08810 [Planctomycetes bacterium]|nr:hypothetical protein [Planctomycetota bacterium]
MAGKRKTLSGKIHVGCIIALVVVIIAGVIGLPYLARIGTAMMLVKSTEILADELEMSPVEKDAVMEKINTLAEKIKSGEMDRTQIEKLSQNLAEGPLPTMIMARMVETRYLKPSTLPEEVKAAGVVTLSRFAQGIITQAIPPAKSEEIEQVLFEIPKEEKDSQEETSYRDYKLKESIPDAELTELLANMKAAADEAEIAEFVNRPDLAGEIQKAIDAILAPEPAPAS